MTDATSQEPRAIDVQWEGPFGFIPDKSLPDVFECDYASRKGVYLWTVKIEDGYLTNYVGETGKSDKTFVSRLEEGVRWYLSGQDDMVDPDDFICGVRTVLLKGGNVQAFLAEYSRWTHDIHRVMCTYRVFLAPLDETILGHRKRIESAIIRELRSTDERCNQFLANSRCSPLPESTIQVNFSLPVVLLGLGSQLTV